MRNAMGLTKTAMDESMKRLLGWLFNVVLVPVSLMERRSVVMARSSIHAFRDKGQMLTGLVMV
tara:strand:+ start:80 stop:268 length:189 start_codon:yes stop_codon:yes gene_type:complete